MARNPWRSRKARAIAVDRLRTVRRPGSRLLAARVELRNISRRPRLSLHLRERTPGDRGAAHPPHRRNHRLIAERVIDLDIRRATGAADFLWGTLVMPRGVWRQQEAPSCPDLFRASTSFFAS